MESAVQIFHGSLRQMWRGRSSALPAKRSVDEGVFRLFIGSSETEKAGGQRNGDWQITSGRADIPAFPLFRMRQSVCVGIDEFGLGALQKLSVFDTAAGLWQIRSGYREVSFENRHSLAEGYMNLQDVLSRLRGVKKYSDGYVALCPAHDDHNPSLSVRETGGVVLMYCHAGCNYEEIRAAIGGLENNEQFNGSNGSAGLRSTTQPRPSKKATVIQGDRDERHVIRKRLVAEYEYCDQTGSPVFTIVRNAVEYSDGSEEKAFRAKRPPRENEPAGNDGWIHNLNDVQLVPYNLPAVVASELIYIVEGEKDAETLRAIGLTATCNPFGAGKWRAEFNKWFDGKVVVILPDNDEVGASHAETVAVSLNGLTKETLLIELPGLPPKGDVTDFIEAGGTADVLMDLVQRASAWPQARTANAENLSKFRFTPLDQLLCEPVEETQFIWDQTLPSGGFSICSAKPKVGKSTLARNLAIAVATGTPFLGRETVKGRVLYLCLEEKRSEIRNHFERMGVSSGDILIHTGTTPENAITEIGMAIAEFDPILVIIDPLSRVVRARDFNDYGAMSRELEPIIDLARKSGCHILALHHDSKMGGSGGDALLGSTALFGSVDCHIQLRKKEGTRILSTTQRYGEDIEETVIELEKETGLVADSGSLSNFVRSKAKEAIIAEIKKGEELDESSIKSRIDGFNRGTIAKAIRDLVDERKMKRKGGGKKGDPYVYEIDEWVM